MKTALEQIGDILGDYTHSEGKLSLESTPLLRNVAKKMEDGKELLFILPAFPAKSPSPEKTTGTLPDLGEVLALQNLQDLCQRIGSVYGPGARVVICSDGRVFSDVVKVSDEDIDRYTQGINDIIQEFQLGQLSTFSMDDLYPELKGHDLRLKLLNHFGKSVEDVRNLVLTNGDYKALFNGMHRFLLEDELALSKAKSRSQISKETKERTYELMRRSDAWSLLLTEYFKDELRLSIHPYPPEHEKFGVKLVSSSNKWATPWHNVTVRIKNKFELMHLKEAKALKGTMKLLKDKYAYFEVAEA